MNIYLDNAATTPLSDSMKKYLISVLDLYGNPSSLHSVGDEARRIVSDARQSVAKFIHADPNNIVFTPSGSASNTLAIHGYCSGNDCHILYSPIAHKSILKCAEKHLHAHPLKTDSHGFIDTEYLNKWLDTHDVRPFVVVDSANSEIGTIQNLKEIIDLVHLHNGIVYFDCTGSIPTIPVDVRTLCADMLGFSAHKLGGLKGCGVLYRKSSLTLEPLICGSQEQGLVGGTENILGIASLGKAVSDYDYSSVTPDNRDYVYNYITRHIPDSYLVGAPITPGKRLPHNLYMCFQRVEGEALLSLLDLNGIQVSTGSACNSRSTVPSAALSATGMNRDDLHSCIRLTFSGTETTEELNYICEKLRECVTNLRKLNME